MQRLRYRRWQGEISKFVIVKRDGKTVRKPHFFTSFITHYRHVLLYELPSRPSESIHIPMAVRLAAFVIVIILVIVLGFPEGLCRFDFGDYSISFYF